VFDVSDPYNPDHISICNTGGISHDVDVAGNYAYVGDGGYLRVIDISNPHAIIEVGSCQTSGFAEKVSVADGYVYVTDDEWTGYLSVVDVSDPLEPTEVGATAIGQYGLKDAVALNGYVYLAYGGDLLVFDVNDPTNPTQVASCQVEENAWGVAISGDQVSVVCRFSAMSVIGSTSVSNPLVPTVTGSYFAPGRLYNVAISDGYAYLADVEEGLLVAEINSPNGPVEIGSFETLGEPYDVAVADGFVYLTDSLEGLQVFDVNNPYYPFIITTIDTYSSFVAIAGQHLYVASPSLYIFDISNPYVPIQIGYLGVGFLSDMIVEGNHAYLVDYNAGLRVVDISDPTSPIVVGSLPMQALSVDVSGDYAYLAAEFDGLVIVDISDPADPIQIASYNLQSYRTEEVKVVDGYAYVGYEQSPGFPRTRYMRVINVTNPATPIEVGYYETPGELKDIAAENGFVYVADKFYFHILDCTQALPVDEKMIDLTPVSFSLGAAYPNPFNPLTTLRIDLPHPSNLQSVVYNMLGQPVAMLADGRFLAGQHMLTFDGTALATGQYFIRVQVVGHLDETRKVVLLK